MTITSFGQRPARYLFCGGLHRSGTSLVAAMIAAHPEVSAIEKSPAPENEGVYLQGAIPHTARTGEPGRFAEDSAQHLTESSPYNSLAVLDHLSAQWAPWFDPAKPWRIEKSPVNLMRARLLQQLFPLSAFVFVVRHPVAVTLATAKWSDRGAGALMGHWNAAHARLLDDLPYLHNWMILRYEDVVADPARTMARVHAFMELDPVPPRIEVRAGVNDAYFADWRPVEAETAIMERFGYALDPPRTGTMRSPFVRHVYNSVTAAVSAS